MSIKETIEMNKKPVIIAVVGVIIIIILVIVFVPFGGDNKAPMPTANVISKKAKITPPAEQKPVELAKTDAAKVEPAMTDTAKVEPVKPDTAKTATAKTDTTKIEPVKPDTAKTVTAKTDTVKIEPVKPDTAKTVTAKTDTAKVDNSKTKSDRVKATVTKKTVTPVATGAADSSVDIKKITKQWAVNTASFSNREEADKFAAKLKAAGYDTVYTTKFKKDGVNWHRVRVGFYSNQKEARKIETAISDKFHIDTPWAVKASKTEVARHIK